MLCVKLCELELEAVPARTAKWVALRESGFNDYLRIIQSYTANMFSLFGGKVNKLTSRNSQCHQHGGKAQTTRNVN